MATNNYFGFTSGGTQYGTNPSYQTGQATATYALQPNPPPQPYGTAPRPSTPAAPSYDTAYQPTHSTSSYPYATAATAAAAPVRQPGRGRDYGGYAKNATYEKAQTYYQTSSSSTAAYSTTETSHYQSMNKGTSYSNSYGGPRQQGPKTPATTTSYVYGAYSSGSTFSGSSSDQYRPAYSQSQQQQQQSLGSSKVTNSWQFRKPGGTGGSTYNKNQRPKVAPRPMQLHYCEVCKISCAGPQTYQEHLEGQKHKKKEVASRTTAAQQPRTGGVSLRCELCDVTCTGQDAYSAHIRGIKHQKVVKLHTRLGKPIPSDDPVVLAGDGKAEKKEVVSPTKVNPAGGKPEGGPKADEKDEIQPVGQDYIEEIKNDDGKVISFLCKLCDCRFNDPNAKEMHMKGRRHRLQYKKKVNPELVVDIKPSMRQRKLHEERLRRHLAEEFWKRKEEERWREEMRHMEEQERLYWEDRRRYEEEYFEWHRRFGGRDPPPPRMMGPPPRYPMMGPPVRKMETSDDRHVLAKHSQIYPKEEELNIIQKNVTNTEKALKLVSDILSVEAGGPEMKKEEPPAAANPEGQNGDSPDRVLKGVMRVGVLAKGLLLTGDTSVQLVVMCSEKPTRSLLEKVASLLPKQLSCVTEDCKYLVSQEDGDLVVKEEGAVKVDIHITLTSPLMRDQAGDEQTPAAPVVKDPPDILDRLKCLEALAALRHAKWFQARASGLQSCVMIIRILRDLCQRVPTWARLTPWAMELVVEKVLSSAGQPLSPGEALRRVLEAIASGMLLPGGPGLMDPCEKDPTDAAAGLVPQEREDLTASAQHALRLFAFRQVHKVLGMDPLPPPKFTRGGGPFGRKRRRDDAGGTEQEGSDGKKGKTDTEVKMETQETPKP